MTTPAEGSLALPVLDTDLEARLRARLVEVEAELWFAPVSVAAPAGMLAVTVPAPVIPVTCTVYVGPAPLTTAATPTERNDATSEAVPGIASAR